jgi:formate hydrogenlyase subunit 3/multisubunit Na+/H+ antiporter MnhD subunit
MLAYSTIAQIGEITAIIGVGTSLAYTGALTHIMTHGVMKTLLFLGAGAFIYRIGSRKLTDLSGIGRTMPITTLLFVIGLLSIIGVPPFAGFMSKFLMVYAGIEAGLWPVSIALLLGGVIGVLYYGRLIRIVMFDETSDVAAKASEAPWPMWLPLGIMAALLIVNGLLPQQMLDYASSVADSISSARGLQNAVLPDFTVHWPIAAIICAIGGLATLALGRGNRHIAGTIAATTLALALAAIIFEADKYNLLSFGFALVIAGIGMLNLIYTIGYFAHHGAKAERFMGLFVLMIGGLIGMTGSNDLFSFFFFWEIMSSWTLYFAIIHEESEDALREGFKYFLFNMVGASFLFLGVTILGVAAGSFSFSAIKTAAPDISLPILALGVGAAAIGFAMKAAMFTVRVDYQMHPATAPTPVSGYISAVLLKSGPIGVFQLILLVGGGAVLSQLGTISGLDPISYFLVCLGAVTAIYAGLMAMIQSGVKRLLIYSTVAQLGYVMTGLALGDSLSTAGGLAHAFNHALLKNTLFLAAGTILAQQHLNSLDELGGVGRRMPWTFGIFMFSGLSLAGLPPFNGFASKWMLYEGALTTGHPFIALLLMGASIATLAAVLKFVHAGFLGHPTPQAEKLREAPLVMLLPMLLLTLASLAISLMPGLLLVPVAKVQAALGIPAIDASWFGPLPGAYGWHPLAIVLPLFVLLLIGWLLMSLGGRQTVTTHAHTCGVDIAPGGMRIAASHLYGSPGRLIRKALLVQEDRQ